MDLFNEILILTFSLFSIFTKVFPAVHEKQFRTHSLIPIGNVNCETIRFRTLDDKCHRTHSKFPVKGSCTKYINCYQNGDGELVSREEECDAGTIFVSKWKTCGYSATPSSCLQTQCGELRTSDSSKNGDERRRRHPPHTVQPQQQPNPLNCKPEEEDDDEELEFGKIPKPCQPVKIGADNQSPNWNPGSASAPNQAPSNMNGYYSPGGQQASSVFGNREAGRTQTPGYGGNREAGRGQGGQNVYGNRGGQGQWQWPVDTETTPGKPDTDTKYKPGDNDKNGYPSFPGGQEPSVPTLKPNLQEQEEEEFNKGQHSGGNSEPGQEDEHFESEEPVHQSQVQNSSENLHWKMETMMAILCVFVSLYS